MARPEGRDDQNLIPGKLLKSIFMFNGKTKSDTFALGGDAPVSTSASLIGAGTTMKGDVTSNGDLRIDGTLVGNIHCSAKVVIGANGVVQGDINGQQADIMGKVAGTIKVKDLLQLKGGSVVNGNIQATKLQIEPTANFNGECHMTPAAVGSAPSGNGKPADVKKEVKHAEIAAAG
jgi:cytoskeletal protein CcmA (bactofilin family)